MEIQRKTKAENNGEMMTLLTLYSLYKHAMANGKAPVTAALMFCNVLTYFRKPGLITNALLPTIDQVWVNSYHLLKFKEQKRFYLSQFYHLGRNHFVYDMLQLLWNGVELEPMMGWLDYASMLGSLLLICDNINFVGRYLVMLAGGNCIYEGQKMVGCTNVMFALDYIRKAMREGDRYILGYRVPRHLSLWIELIVAKIAGAGDLLGNLAGVLTGIVYLQLNSRNGGRDPMAQMIRRLFGLRRSDDNSQRDEDERVLRRIPEGFRQLDFALRLVKNRFIANYGEPPRGDWMEWNRLVRNLERMQARMLRRHNRPSNEIQLYDTESSDEE